MYKWIEIIAITLFIKVLLLILVISQTNDPNFNLVDTWVRWDGPHYIDIARNGYQTEGDPANFIVFYPLYPLLIKLVGLIVGNLNLSALIISWASSVVASIFLYKLALLDFNKRIAFLSVWFLNIFPTAYFLQASYTESLFLALSLASIYFFRTSNNSYSGFLASLSSFTRFNGLLLIPFFVTELGIKKINLHKLLRIFLITTSTIVGFLGYLLLNFLTFGEFFYFRTPLSQHWYKQLELTWVSINNLINFITSMQSINYYIFMGELVAILFTVIISIYVFFKVRISYGVYMMANLLLFVSTGFIMSTPRYILLLFPIYIALAKLSSKIFFALISIIFISLLIFLTLQYTKGAWAY